MSTQEQSDYPLLAYHYNVALISGVDKVKAKAFAQAQVNHLIEISHLRVIEL